MMNASSRHSLLLTIPLLIVVGLVTACRPTPHPAAQSLWQTLRPGDYMREEYTRAVDETRSPFKAWQKMEAMKNEGVETITITNDKQGAILDVGYNFHEGTGPFRPEADGSLNLDKHYSFQVLDKDRFVLSDDRSSMRFRYVGDWQKWPNEAVIAGVYEDEKGQRYIFRPDGQAEFPGNRTFDYNVGLDMIFSSYDYIYSNKLNETWAIKATPNGLVLFDVDLSGDDPEGVVSPTPRWKLRRLAP